MDTSTGTDGHEATDDWLAPVTTLLDDQVASAHLPGAALAVRRGGRHGCTPPDGGLWEAVPR